MNKKLLFVVNVDWFFLSHRLPIALRAQKNGYEVHIATALTGKLGDLQSYGLKVHPLRLMRGGISPLNAFTTIFDLLRIFREIQPDIVHLVTIKPVLLGGLVARWLGVPAVVSAVSGLGFVFTATSPGSKLRRWAVGRIYSWALNHNKQTVIFQNRDDCETLISEVGLSQTKVKIIRGSGVDLNQYIATPEPLGLPVVLLPARLLADKGVFEFVEAARLLHARGVSARFVLAGMVDVDNPTSVPRTQLDDWISEGVVEYWGYRRDMPQVIASSTLVVLPSYREGLPKVLLEAAACGRAVVTTDVPGCRDAIEPNLTGLLVPVHDAKGLALSIEYLLANPAHRSAMGLAGRKLAEEEFDVLAVVDKHLEIYGRLSV